MNKTLFIMLPWLIAFLGILLVEVGIRSAADISVSINDPQFIASFLHEMRGIPFSIIDNSSSAAIVSGVVFGRDEHLSQEQKDTFLNSGLTHLLAASGQNIALIVTSCILFFSFLRTPRVIGALVAAVFIPIYVLIVGGGASIVRAGIVGQLGILAWLSGRLSDAKYFLGVAAALICWIWPGAHRSLGMQLSFACSAVLILGAINATKYLHNFGIHKYISAALATTALCSIVTAPILILRTGSAPFTAAVSNLVAIPIASAILIIGLSGVLFQLIGISTLGNIGLYISGFLAKELSLVADRAAKLPLAQVNNIWLVFAVWVLIVPTACFYNSKYIHHIKVGSAYISVLFITIGIVHTFFLSNGLTTKSNVPIRNKGTVRVSALDVGQGDATLIDTDKGSILIDTGLPNSNVVKRIKELKVKRITGLILTHHGLDHRGSFEAVISSFKPQWVAIPKNAPGSWKLFRDLAPRIIEMCEGDNLKLAELSIRILNPPCMGKAPRKTGDDHNDAAIVSLLTYKTTTMLVAADAESPILRTLKMPSIDILRVAHHGSEDPELGDLLEQIDRPSIAIISVGKDNSYGHPRPSVIRTLKSSHANILRTDQNGTVVLDMDKSKVLVRS